MNQQAVIWSTFRESAVLDNSRQLDEFLKSIQGRACRVAQLVTGNPADALGLVQKAMFKLAKEYSDRNQPEWTSLFYRMPGNPINDWYCRTGVHNKYRSWLHSDGENPIANAAEEESA